MSIKVVLEPYGKMPTRAHDTDAGFDFYIPFERVIRAHSFEKVLTGVHVAIPFGYVGRMASKSGLMSRGITVMGGEIDAGYTGEIAAMIRNETNEDFVFRAGMKFCQMIIQPISFDSMELVEKLEDSDRGAGGFGSTGAY